MERWHVRENQNGSSELYHYGVKGMRWGVRKDYETKGRTKVKKLNAVEITKRTDNGDSKIHINDVKDYKMRNDLMDNGYSVAKYVSESEALYKFKNLPKYSMRLSQEQQALAVNHNAPDYDRKNNCFECTMAYEMRRRGYNVQANKVSGGYAFEAMHAFDIKDSFRLEMSSPDGSYLSSKTLAEEAYRRTEETCLRYGEGARGMMGIYYAEPYDGGHAMNWVVENGKFKILDNQSNAIDPYESFLYSDGNIDVYRLDNAEVLPGVTDFVEAHEATDKEKAEAKKRYENAKKVWNKEGYANEYKETGKNFAEKFFNSAKEIGSKVGEYISTGIEVVSNFLKNPLGIQKNDSTDRGNGGFAKVTRR